MPVRPTSDPPAPPHSIEQIRRMHGLAKAKAAIALAAYADSRAAQARDLRDEGIREAKADHTGPAIAAELGISLGAVKAVRR